MRASWMVVAAVIGVTGIPWAAKAEEASLHPITTSLRPHMNLPGSTQLPHDLLLDELARAYTTPQAVAGFLKRTFAFRRDQDLFGEADHWQSPQEFLARKAGDCEDYALLAQALLAKNGIMAYVFSVFGEEGYAHTVCVFQDERGRYNVINQDKLRPYRAASLEALAAELYPAWTWAAVAEQEGTRGRLVQSFNNSHPAPTFSDPITGF